MMVISAREMTVLKELAAGHSNKEIAARLHVSPNTVKTHVARLFEKLGARRRTDAINRAREIGIRQLRQFLARHHPPGIEQANLRRNRARSERMVARDHHGRDACVPARSHSRRRFNSRRIHHAHQADQRLGHVVPCGPRSGPGENTLNTCTSPVSAIIAAMK